MLRVLTDNQNLDQFHAYNSGTKAKINSLILIKKDYISGLSEQ